MEDFKHEESPYDITECPLCGYKAIKKDIEISYERLNKKQRVEAFSVILQSVKLLSNGFDWVNNETFEAWYRELEPPKKAEVKKIYNLQGIERKYAYEYFTRNIDQRLNLWEDVFNRLPKKKQVEYLEELENTYKLYTETNALLEANKDYDWSEFECRLEETKPELVTYFQNTWNELGNQVQDSCKENGLCPCLRESSNSATAYKCFKGYLEDNCLSPNGKVPSELRHC